jgi:hypothetical protein
MISAEVRVEAKMVEGLPIMIEHEGCMLDGFRGCSVYNIRYVACAIMVFLMHSHSQVRVYVYYSRKYDNRSRWEHLFSDR